MEHYELVQEMGSIERMVTQDRLKHARKRRSQQLKKWNQYERQLEKENSKKKKKQDAGQGAAGRKKPRRTDERVRFIANIALLESAARNDLDEVGKLLQNKVSPDVTNEDGLTALHQCCIDDNEEMLKLLLEYGANVNACDSEMWTPLHAAATCGHVALCKLLIDSGAELLAVNADGNMPYDICEDEMTLDYIETEMAKRGITQEQIDQTRLTTERQMLSDLKSVENSGLDLEFKDPSGATLLHIAAANGYLDVADYLLDHHVSVDARDNESWQPIHAASYWGQLEILELLVQNGADLDSKTRNGEMPFDLCEDPDIKQRILDMKDEIETNKASRQRPGSSRKHKHNSRNASIRRSSLRGEKSNLFKKEAHEEALHFGLRLMQDEEELADVEEEKENLPATNIDDVTISIEDQEDHKAGSVGSSSLSSLHNTSQSQAARSDRNSSRASHVDRVDRTTGSHAVVPSPSSRSPPRGASGSAPNDLKNQHSDSKISEKDSRKEALDAQFQSMFLESVPNSNRRMVNSSSPTSTSSVSQPQLHFYPPPMMEKTKNGHNNSNNNNNNNNPGPPPTAATANANNAGGPHLNFREGQLRRFVAPPSAPVVGSDEEKQKCCVIL